MKKKDNLIKASNKSLKIAAKILKKGGVVAFPTETVYGLGACAFDSKAAAKIFKIKKRPFFDPLIVHICDKNQLSSLSGEIPTKVKKLINLFWPGPLTLILKKNSSVPDIVTAGLNTVAVRMPSCQISLKLIKEAGFPIAAPSANLFSRTSPVRASHVKNQLKNGPDLILDAGKTLKGVESTIIGFEKGKFYILREGALPSDEIEKKAKIKLIKTKKYKITAPGMLKKHYSPKAEVVIVKGEKKARDLRAAYIAFKKLPLKNFKYKKVLSAEGNLEEAAANLFDFFHEIEKMKIKKIYIEKVPQKGLGKAINDRIVRSAAQEG